MAIQDKYSQINVTTFISIDIVNFLPYSKILDCQVESFCRQKINVAQIVLSCLCSGLKKKKKRRKKEKNCWLQAFSPFSAVFPEAFFLRFAKTGDCLAKG